MEKVYRKYKHQKIVSGRFQILVSLEKLVYAKSEKGLSKNL